MPDEMIQSRGSGARLALLLVCTLMTAAATAQVRKRPITDVLASPQGNVLTEAVPRMPNVLWLERGAAEVVIRQRLHRVAKIGGNGRLVLAQDPVPDTPMAADTPIVLTVGTPRLVFSASKLNPQVGEAVAFSIAFDPPPANSPAIEYHFVWDDGGGDQATAAPRVTHSFKEAGAHSVTAYATLNKEQFAERAAMRIAVAPPPLPPPPEPLPPPPVPPVTMPQLLWLERSEADAALAPLKLSASIAGQDGIVLEQSVPPGADVAPGSPVTITLALPKLTLSASTLTPAANEDVTFSLAFDPPPPPAPPKISYRFRWDPNSEEPSDQATVTHRFSASGQYVVSAVAVIGNRTLESNSLTLSLNAPSKMPQLFWLERAEAERQLRALNLTAKIDGQEGVVLAQNPPAGSDIQPRSTVSFTLGLPKLALSASTQEARVNDAVTFKAALDPPPPASNKITYHFEWRDGTPATSVDQTEATHRFTNRGTYGVFASAQINDRSIVVSDRVRLSVIDASSKISWPLILLGAVALSVAAYFVARAATLPPQVPPASVSFQTGVDSISHTIEHAEQIRNGVSVRLRGGMRADG
jgi:beta-lactam-binding protein with PASTA domain